MTCAPRRSCELHPETTAPGHAHRGRRLHAEPATPSTASTRSLLWPRPRHLDERPPRELRLRQRRRHRRVGLRGGPRGRQAGVHPRRRDRAARRRAGLRRRAAAQQPRRGRQRRRRAPPRRARPARPLRPGPGVLMATGNVRSPRQRRRRSTSSSTGSTGPPASSATSASGSSASSSRSSARPPSDRCSPTPSATPRTTRIAGREPRRAHGRAQARVGPVPDDEHARDPRARRRACSSSAAPSAPRSSPSTARRC
jgi:hypothetical protein